MQVSVETMEGLERKMTVALPSDALNDEVGKRLNELTKTAKINGFRPGKVPLSVVKKRYGAGIHQEVMGEKIQSSFYKALEQEKLRMAGDPKIDLNEKDGGLGYTATFEVYPSVKTADLSSAEIETWTAEVTDQDVDNMVETLRTRAATWETVERASAMGDQVIIDYKGSIDGAPFDGGEGQGMRVALGEKQMIAGFEEHLLDKSAGDPVEMDLTFPEDYKAELAGKAVHFSVTVDHVEQAVLPEVDADFMQKLGVEADNVDLFKAEVRENLEHELTQKITEKHKQKVMDLLVEKHPIDIPKGLLEMEIKALMEQARGMANMPADAPLPRESFAAEALKRVTIGLVISEIVNENNIEVSPEKVSEKIAYFAQSYENPQEMMDFYVRDEKQRRNVESLVLEEQVVDWVLSQAKLNEKTVSFDEVVKPTAA